MKRLYFPLIAMAMATPTLCHAYNTWGGADYTDKFLGVTWDKTWTRAGGLQTATTAKAASWMADLPDNMFVAHVSIPGAHDFATGEDNWVTSVANGPASSTTQAVTMREQMDRGIRGIDLRPGLHDGKLYCNHGLAQTEKTLKEAVDDMIYFLQQHPTEFFVVHFFRGNVYRSGEGGAATLVGGSNSAADQTTYNKLMQEIFQTNTLTDKDGNPKTVGDYVVNFSPNLTVKEARGKMVLFLRDRIDFVHLDKQARITNWDTEFKNADNPAKITNELDSRLSSNLHVQDISEGDDNTLWNQKVPYCRNLIEFAQTQPTPAEIRAANNGYKAEWVMNFTSIDNSGSSKTSDNTNGYKGGASLMNDNAREYIEANLGRGPLGVFFSDYVLRTQTKKHSADRYYTVNGDQLVYKIIENNFTGGEEAPVVRYALDDTHDWTSMPTRYYLRNVGASRDAGKDLFYGAGSTWGTRCTLDEAGAAVNLNLDSDGHYRIKSNFGELYWGENKFFCDGGSGIGFILTNTTYNGKPVYIFNETNGNFLSAFKFNGEAAEDVDKTKAYSDRPDYFVYARDPKDVTDETYHMWELVAEEDRIAELEREAKLVKPYNATFMVPGYGFGQGGEKDMLNAMWTPTLGAGKDPSSSVVHDETVFAGLETTQGGGAVYRLYNKKKRAFLNASSNDYAVEGKITGLPNGTYDFYCQAVTHNSAVTATIAGTEYSVSRRNDQTTEDVNVATKWFSESADNGKIEKKRFEVTDGTISMSFKKTIATESATAFFLDNIHLTYYGHAHKVEITFPEHWNTVILPFDVSETDLTAVKGDDLHFYQATGLETTGKVLQENLGELYEYHLVTRSSDINNLKANTPYIVENNAITEVVPKVTSKQAPMRRAATEAEQAAAAKVYTFSGYPIDTEATYTDGNNILTGVLADDYEIGEGHYALQTTNFQLFGKLEEGEMANIGKYRAFVHADSPQPIHPMILFNDVENVLTGVEDVAAEEQGITDETPVDVYTTGGMMLRHGVAKGEALTELPRGIYILAAGATTLKVAK